MIVFMLNHSTCKSFKCFFLWLKIFIEIADMNFIRSLNVFPDFRNAQASLIVSPWRAIFGNGLCIDENSSNRLLIFKVVFIFFLVFLQGLNASVVSTTKSRMERPTCGAASPTPLASCMVSNISVINVCKSG